MQSCCCESSDHRRVLDRTQLLAEHPKALACSDVIRLLLRASRFQNIRERAGYFSSAGCVARCQSAKPSPVQTRIALSARITIPAATAIVVTHALFVKGPIIFERLVKKINAMIGTGKTKLKTT